MIIKHLSLVLFTTVTASFCSIAYANSNSGFYVGGQLGYGKADYGNVAKKLDSTPPITISESLFDQVTIVPYLPNQKTNDDGTAGRIYAGYQFNQFFGVETGYTLFSDNHYKASNNELGYIANDASLETQQWDILGKAGMPFGESGFRGDIKAGAALIMSKLKIKQTESLPSFNYNQVRNFSATQNEWAPIAGAGLSYNVNQNLAVDISYLHAFGSGNLNTPNTDLITLGVSYHFA